MQILIATDGDLDADKASDLAARLAEPGEAVTVVTVVEVPRTLLEDLRGFYVTPPPKVRIDEDHEYVDQPTGGTISTHWPGDDAMIARYITDQTGKRTGALRDALRRRGIEPTVVSRESDAPARTILDLVAELEADVLCIGTRGRGRFEGLLGSTGSKLARLAPCDVLLIR